MELSNHQNPGQEGTFHVKITKWRPALKVTADGKGLAIHAGSRLLAEMADRSGLTDALSEALAPMCKRRRRHDPGKVIADRRSPSPAGVMPWRISSACACNQMSTVPWPRSPRRSG